jgi:hypothetical protein
MPRNPPCPEVAAARARVAGLTARRADPKTIETARAGLRAAKARAAVRGLLTLPATERAQLAVMLLTGGGTDAAA